MASVAGITGHQLSFSLAAVAAAEAEVVAGPAVVVAEDLVVSVAVASVAAEPAEAGK